MNINAIKALICSACGAIGSAIATFFGGWTGDMTTLLIFMGIDFVMGLILAGIFKNSSKSASGALQAVYDELNKGQRKKLMKNENIKAL